MHPGGPFWARRDEGAWSIPKGEYDDGADPHDTAIREFTEELGTAPPPGEDLLLGEVRQAGGKVVTAWARAGDFDPTGFTANTFEMEWPRGSGLVATFPEVDRAEWFAVDVAARRINAGQAPLLDLLRSMA